MTFDSSLRQVTCDGCEIDLTPKAFDLLTLLLANAGRVVTKQEVHAALWPDTLVSEATLVGLVKMLRRTLGHLLANSNHSHDARNERVGDANRIRTVAFRRPPRDSSASRSLSADGNEDLIGCTPTGSIDSHAGRGLHQRRGIADHPVTLRTIEPSLRRFRGMFARTTTTLNLCPNLFWATPHSVAVLPFTDLSPQQDQAYLGEGIAEELIHALSAIAGLRVSARSSSFRFAGKAVNIRDVGAQLGVETILEGSIRTADHRLRLTARLVDVNNECQLWSERYRSHSREYLRRSGRDFSRDCREAPSDRAKRARSLIESPSLGGSRSLQPVLAGALLLVPASRRVPFSWRRRVSSGLLPVIRLMHWRTRALQMSTPLSAYMEACRHAWR